jgi:hypothetical protein
MAAAKASMTAAAANQISIENQLLLEQQHQIQDNLRAEKQYEWRISAAPTKPEAGQVQWLFRKSLHSPLIQIQPCYSLDTELTQNPGCVPESFMLLYHCYFFGFELSMEAA